MKPGMEKNGEPELEAKVAVKLYLSTVPLRLWLFVFHHFASTP
jgi:hypothetical protein